MAEELEIQSKEVIDKISEDLKVQPAQKIPRKLSKDIQLTYDCNAPKKLTLASLDLSDTESATIHTCDSKKRTFLMGANLTYSKDAANTGLFSSISITPLGKATADFLILRYEPTTAGNGFAQYNGQCGLELEKGSEILLNHGSDVASIDGSACVYFYEEDPQ